MKRSKKKVIYLSLTVISVLFILFFSFSCGVSSAPKVTSLDYDGKNLLKETTTVEISRNKEISANVVNGKNAEYIWKIDNTVVLRGKDENKYTFNKYKTSLPLNSYFFTVEHTLTLEVRTDNGKSDAVSVKVKFLNMAPVVTITPSTITPKDQVRVEAVDPDEDEIAEFYAKIFNSKGKEVYSANRLPLIVNLESYLLIPDNYILRIYAKDLYGQETTIEKVVSTENTKPKVNIIQPYQGEVVPTSLIVRWQGFDPDPEEFLRYSFLVKKDEKIILSIESTSTEAVLSNLEFNTEYKAFVTVFDSHGATATTNVSFKTVSSPRYSYILSKSFDSKSVISIANTYNLPTVKIEGFVVNTDNTQFVDFDVAEDYIYAVGGTYLYVVNASDKSNPKIVKKVDLGTTLTAIRIYKNYAIIGEGSNGIRIVDLTNPSDPTLTSKNFGKTIKAFSLPVKTTSTKASKTTNSKINVTQGKVMAIRLAADSAYIANNLGGLLRLNLTNIPNITINDITLIHDDQVNDTEIGQFNDKQVIVFAVGKTVKYALLSDAESATEELPSASVTTLGTFDTEIKGVRIYNNSIYAFTVDRIRRWTNDTTWSNVEYEPGSQFNDLIFVGNNSVVLDGGKGLITYQNDSRNEPNKMYEIRDLNYLNNFLFAVGDGFYCNGLYVIDLRDTLEPTVRQHAVGQYLNKIDVKLKAVPKGSSERVAKIVVANTDSRVVKLYDFDYTNLTLSSATPVTLTGYTALYDVAIDAQGRTYVLGRNASGNVIQVFNQDGSAVGLVTLPLSIDQKIPEFPENYKVEPVRPTSIQVVVDYLSESKKPSHVIVGCGGAGIIKYDILIDPSGNITFYQDLSTSETEKKYIIRTTYYVVVRNQDGSVTLSEYKPGTDSAVAVDKYFDRIFVADGDTNGIWLLDKNGDNLTEQGGDNLTKTPFLAGAPARNISWFGDLLFVSGGGFGVKIINIRDMPVIDDTYVTKIPFNGLTYAFHTEADARTMVVGSDKGYLLYDISEFPTVKPISTLNLPMFKIMAK